jgi:hypothetical protein
MRPNRYEWIPSVGSRSDGPDPTWNASNLARRLRILRLGAKGRTGQRRGRRNPVPRQRFARTGPTRSFGLGFGQDQAREVERDTVNPPGHPGRRIRVRSGLTMAEGGMGSPASYDRAVLAPIRAGFRPRSISTAERNYLRAQDRTTASGKGIPHGTAAPLHGSEAISLAQRRRG